MGIPNIPLPQEPKEEKQPRKIVQITATAVSVMDRSKAKLFVLCNDWTVFLFESDNNKWLYVPDIPQD